MYKRARLGIGYLSQEPSIFKFLTVEENLLAIIERNRARRGEDRAHGGADRRLRARARAPEPGGVALGRRATAPWRSARALVTRPKLLLLDEPFAAIDPIAVADIQETVRGLRDKGIGILLTDHNVRETLSTDGSRVHYPRRQILVSGSPAEVIADPTARSVYLGEKFTMWRQSEDDFDASMEILDVFTCHWSLVTCHLSLTELNGIRSRAPRTLS